MYMYMYICICMCVYIYIYICKDFLISKDPKSYLVGQLVWQLINSLSGDNNLVPFCLW